jgi:hypothetical protein
MKNTKYILLLSNTSREQEQQEHLASGWVPAAGGSRSRLRWGKELPQWPIALLEDRQWSGC